MKIFLIVAVAVVLASASAFAADSSTSTWSTINEFGAQAVSNAPSGKEIWFGSPHVITNISVYCIAGTLQVLPSVKGVFLDTTNYIKWATVHATEQLTFPAFGKSFWIRTTNDLNNTFSVIIK